jgi:hypothetical protein
VVGGTHELFVEGPLDRQRLDELGFDGIIASLVFCCRSAGYVCG